VGVALHKYANLHVEERVTHPAKADGRLDKGHVDLSSRLLWRGSAYTLLLMLLLLLLLLLLLPPPPPPLLLLLLLLLLLRVPLVAVRQLV
jgi:hypothetical protein